MSYGIQSWGISSWGGSDFIVTDHVPNDNAIGISRLPTISFTLYSQNGNITLSTINLTANGIQLILNGSFTINTSVGTIDDSNPAVVLVSATVAHSFAPFEVVTVIVDAMNDNNQVPASGTTWSFTVDNTLQLFTNHVVRRFERVLRVSVVGLDAPQNPDAIIVLAAPPDLVAEVV